MENFRKHKTPQKRLGSVDGMLSSKNQKSLNFSRSYQPDRGQATPTLDNFKQRKEGFSALRSQPLTTSPSQVAAQTKAVDTLLEHTDTSLERFDRKNSSTKTKKKGRRLHRTRAFLSKKVVKRTLIFVLVLLLAAGLYFGIKLYFTGKNIFGGGGGAPALAKEVDASKLRGEGDGRINLLLIGHGGPNHPGGNLTDTILIASIDPIHKEAALLSIPRDFWVRIDGGGYSKINSAYNTGLENSDAPTAAQREDEGVKTLSDTVTNVLGIPIHYYTKVNFTAYKQAVDAVGGIDITLDEPLYDPNFDGEYGRNILRFPAGKVHLNGTQAMLLGRARNANGGYGLSRSDFDRNENQRKMLIALKQKVLSVGTFSNPIKVNNLLGTLGSNVRTSINQNEIKRFYEIMSEIPNNKITSLDLVTPPNNLLATDNIGGLSVVLPRAGVGNYKEIQSFVRNTLKDSFLKSESASIAIYNGTNSPGLAATKAEELRSFGYNVTIVADAPSKNYPKTVLVDRTKGVKKYTKRYLEQRLKVTSVNAMPNATINPGTANFVIILGEDEAARQ